MVSPSSSLVELAEHGAERGAQLCKTDLEQRCIRYRRASTAQQQPRDKKQTQTTMAAKPEDIMGDGSILKTIIKEGTGEEKPAWGHKVKVHYTGTLTSNGEKFDSSRDRNSPFDFQVGSGVITGWSEAVPTMLLGEIAKFTISSEKAYGPGGSPPKIPPNASLDFEIELLSFTDREDVLQDGTLMKKQLGKPDEDSWVTPNANCDVEFKLTIAGGDEHAVSWPAGSGCPHGLPPRLREGLFEMRKGETCSFLLPKDAPGVDYEVTLVSWVENEECVNGDDGAVVKRIERDKTIGKDDWKCPHDLDTVHLRGRVWVDGDEAKSVDYGEIPPNTDGSQDASVYVVDEDITTSTGAAICPGVDAVVKKLRVGEISTAIIRKDYGFKDGPLAGQPLRCRLELVKIVPQVPNWEIKTTDLKIEAVFGSVEITQTLRFLESWRWVVFYAISSAFGPRRGRSRGRRAKFGQRRRSAAAAGPTGPWHSRHRLDAVAGSRTPLRWFRASRGAAAAAEDTQTPSHRAPAAATPSTRVVARRGCRGWFLFRI